MSEYRGVLRRLHLNNKYISAEATTSAVNAEPTPIPASIAVLRLDWALTG